MKRHGEDVFWGLVLVASAVVFTIRHEMTPLLGSILLAAGCFLLMMKRPIP